MKLFNLSKTPKPEGCEAMRCKESPDEEVEGFLWGKDTVRLCKTHLAKLEAWIDSGGSAPEEPAQLEKPVTARRLAPVVEIDSLITRNAEQKALAEELYEEVQTLGRA